MGIWGTFLGGAAGFAVAGPIGALLGAVAGHHAGQKVGEKLKDAGWDAIAQSSASTAQMAFTVGVVSLAAKLSKADGVVSRVEIDAFKRLFQIPAEDLAAVGKLFDAAKREATGFEAYAYQLRDLFAATPQMLEEVLDALFEIARADDKLHPAEIAFLHKIADIFGISGRDFGRVEACHDTDADPYAVLGVSRTADNDAIKQVWRRLIRENHPDKLTAQGMPPEFIAVATKKMAAINAAYDHIQKERGFS